jgi:hypothetical protein
MRWKKLFSICLILPAALGPRVYSASNRNEYQNHKNNGNREQSTAGAWGWQPYRNLWADCLDNERSFISTAYYTFNYKIEISLFCFRINKVLHWISFKRTRKILSFFPLAMKCNGSSCLSKDMWFGFETPYCPPRMEGSTENFENKRELYLFWISLKLTLMYLITWSTMI